MKNVLLLFLFSIIIGLIVWDIFFRKQPEPIPVISYEYTPDTVYIPAPYPIPEPYPIEVPPRIVILHEIDSSTIDSLSLIISELDLKVGSLVDTILIYESYLKQFPKNPKLLAIDLKRDTMSMGLLNITGIPQEDKWPIDLSQFNYRWTYASGLSMHPVSKPPTSEKAVAQYFVGGGVDLLHLSPYIGGRVEKGWARIRLYGDVHVGLLDSKASAIRLGVDYKINGSNSHRIR
jgi:hypothetical protein